MSLGFFFLGDDKCVIYVLKVSLFGMEWSFASESCLLHLPQVLANLPVLPCLKLHLYCSWKLEKEWYRWYAATLLPYSYCQHRVFCRWVVYAVVLRERRPSWTSHKEYVPQFYCWEWYLRKGTENGVHHYQYRPVFLILLLLFFLVFSHTFPFTFRMYQFQYFCCTSLCYAKNISIKQYMWNTHHLYSKFFL